MRNLAIAFVILAALPAAAQSPLAWRFFAETRAVDREVELSLVELTIDRNAAALGFPIDVIGGRDVKAFAPYGTWYGESLDLKQAWTVDAGRAARAESFTDAGGTRTGTPQKLNEITLTCGWRPGRHVLTRVEYRVDRSDCAECPGRNQQSVGASIALMY